MDICHVIWDPSTSFLSAQKRKIESFTDETGRKIFHVFVIHLSFAFFFKFFPAFGHMKEHVYPFMTILNDDDYVQLMLESLPKFAATSEGIGTLHLARELGSRVNQRYIIRKKRRSLVAEKVI